MMNRQKITVCAVLTAAVIALVFIYSIAVNSGALSIDLIYRDPIISTIKDSEFSVTFLDAGQGDCAYIRCSDCDILVDFGSSNNFNHLYDVLRRCVTDDLELAIASHPDFDHIGNAKEFIEIFNAEKILAYNGCIEKYEFANKNWNFVKAGDTFTCGDILLEVLSPSSIFDNDNDNSLVVRVKYKDVSFLFTGDISQEAEKEILNKNIDVSADVIKIGHHGSKSSSCEEFLKKVDPALAIISVGENNSYGLPSEVTLERLSKLGVPYYRTSIYGDITVASDGTSLSIITSKSY